MTALVLERNAIERDAHHKIRELKNVARVLWPDRDDPAVLSELLAVMSEIRQAEQALRGGQR